MCKIQTKGDTMSGSTSSHSFIRTTDGQKTAVANEYQVYNKLHCTLEELFPLFWPGCWWWEKYACKSHARATFFSWTVTDKKTSKVSIFISSLIFFHWEHDDLDGKMNMRILNSRALRLCVALLFTYVNIKENTRNSLYFPMLCAHIHF